MIVVNDNVCSIVMNKEDLIKIKHKVVVYEQHWYQLELKERKKDDTHVEVYSNLTDDVISLLDLRILLQESTEVKQDRLWKSFCNGFMKNLYCVGLGKIYSPTIHPSNFFYMGKNKRVITFIRSAKGLEEVTQDWLASVYKTLAFMLTPSTIEIKNYESDTINDYIAVMTEKNKERFNELTKASSLAGLVNLFVTEEDQEAIEAYLSVVIGYKNAIGLDLSLDLDELLNVEVEESEEVVEEPIKKVKEPKAPKEKKPKQPRKKKYKKCKVPTKKGQPLNERQTVMFSELNVKNRRRKRSSSSIWSILFVALTGIGILIGLKLMGGF